MTTTRTASYFPVTPGALFSELKWSHESEFTQFTDLVSGESTNSRKFKRSLLSIKFANVAMLKGQRFTVAVGNPNEPSVSQSIFGVVAAMPSELTTSVEDNLSGITAIASLDPKHAPASGYCVAQLPPTADFCGIAVFGGVNFSAIPGDDGGTKKSVDNSDVFLFGVWTVGSTPADMNTKKGVDIFPVPGSREFVYGWYRVPPNNAKTAAPPRSLGASAVVNVGSVRTGDSGDRLFIFGGVGGSGLTQEETKTAMDKSSGNPEMTKSVKAVESAQDALNARIDDKKSVVCASLLFFTETVMAIADRVNELGSSFATLHANYTDQAASSYETAAESMKEYAFGAIALDLAKEAYDNFENAIRKPTELDTVYDEVFYTATVFRLRASAIKRAENLDEEITTSLMAPAFVSSIKAAARASLYIAQFGSARETSETLRDAWLVDYATGDWESVRVPDAIAPRYGATAISSWDTSRVYLFGGHRMGSVDAFREVWEMRGSDRQWTRIFSLPGPPLPCLELNHAAFSSVPDGSIVFHGGFASCVPSGKLLPAYFEPSLFLDEEFEKTCEDSVAASIGSKRRVTSNDVWVFHPPGYAAAKRSDQGKWVEVPTISTSGATTASKRANAFHSAIVSENDSLQRTYTLTFVGGVHIGENAEITKQMSVELLAESQPYPINALVIRRTGTAPIVSDDALDLTKPVPARSQTFVAILSVLLIMIWTSIAIISIIQVVR